jgi:oligopeptide transport system substrate-binding protein
MNVLRGMLGLSLAALLLAGCGPSQTQQSGANAPAAQSEMVLRRGITAEPDSIDPHLNTTLWGAHVVGDMLMGLYTEDAQARPIPAAAADASVSEDGRTWTFHLRDHLWSDGMPVTADDFVYAWRRAVDPKTASKYASMLYVFKNALPITEGKMPPTSLGARAPDSKTIVLELEHPAPYLPELLTHPMSFPVPRHVVEAKGTAWTQAGNYVSNGAYVLQQWVPGDHLTLVKNARFVDAAGVKIDRVLYYPTEDAQAGLRRFRAGELDIIDPLPAQQIDWIRANIPETLKQTPILSVDYVVMNFKRKPFDDIRVREAMNLAYDRELITNVIYRLGETPAYNLLPPGVANYPGGASYPFKGMAKPERIRRAQELMRQAGYGPDKHLKTTYLTPSLPDQRRAAAATQEMWREIYVDVEIVQQESQVVYARLKEGDFDTSPAAWIADFNDPSNFLFLLTTENGGLNYGRYSNPKFDRLFAAAEQEKDVERRGDMLLECEKIALADQAWITRDFRSTRELVQPAVKNWIPNLRDINRTRWLSVEAGATR